MASPYRTSSPTPTGPAQSVVHASTSTIVKDEGELAMKLEAARDDESRFEVAFLQCQQRSAGLRPTAPDETAADAAALPAQT